MICINLYNANITYSEGTRSDRIVKLSQKGLIWKTWEGEMIMDGMRTRNTPDGCTRSIANTW